MSESTKGRSPRRESDRDEQRSVSSMCEIDSKDSRDMDRRRSVDIVVQPHEKRAMIREGAVTETEEMLGLCFDAN